MPFSQQQRVAGETDFTGRVGNEHGFDSGLLAEPINDEPQSFEVAFQHCVFQGRLQQAVHLSSCLGALGGQLSAVQADIKQQENQRAEQEPGRSTKAELLTQTGGWPDHASTPVKWSDSLWRVGFADGGKNTAHP